MMLVQCRSRALSAIVCLAVLWSLVVSKTATASDLDPQLLDCQIRKLSLRFAQDIQPFRATFCDVRDALRLDELCPNSLLTDNEKDDFQRQQLLACKGKTGSIPNKSVADEGNKWWCPAKNASRGCIYILSNQESSTKRNLGHTTTSRVIATSVREALDIARRDMIKQDGRQESLYLVFRNGTHYINETIELGAEDSGLVLTNYPGEEAWISGGKPLLGKDNTPLKWEKFKRPRIGQESATIYTTSLSVLNLTSDDLPTIPSIFGRNRRWIRARFPNANPETAQWGYNSPNKLKYSMPADDVIEWHKPQAGGPVPTFTFHPNLKNDSSMYNDYASGSGGVCSGVWGDGPSYWCSNASSGGWAEVDRECAMTGRLQLPVGLTYNATASRAARMPHFAPQAIVHAWHSQSWAMHMFVVEDHDEIHQEVTFAAGGGRQGGRNWCRCDQCTYAGRWCGQHQDENSRDDRLISGTWAVENVLDELDVPGEYYLDRENLRLYVYPNSTNDLLDLRIAVLTELIRIQNSTDIQIKGLGFRDTAATYLEDWGVPSGGDWALHRGGAVYIEDSERINIKSCTFRRLDSNGVFLSNRTREVGIEHNVFEWLGENAIATWGWTDDFNATAELFPMGTLINGNIMRELGIYQKQSSAVAHNKAALTIIVNNIMFNMPRAAINFNDMVGGGDVVDRNLIFNTCRESGDHGPINSWDRQPFLSTIGGDLPSFVPLRRTVKFNLIFANYGSSQGVDNDDGSSWYHLHHNLFYDADGFKMDYGGHDSIYEHNLVVGFPHRVSCIGFGSFLPGHGHVVRNNRCIVPSIAKPIIELAGCDKTANVVLASNHYFGPSKNITIRCGYGNDPIPFLAAQKMYSIEYKSTIDTLPSNQQILAWANETLYPVRKFKVIEVELEAA